MKLEAMLLVSTFIILIFIYFLIFFLNPLPSYSVASGSNNTFIQAACVASLVHNYGYCYSKGWNHIHYNNHKIYFLCFWQKITLVMSAWMSLKIMLKEFKWFPHQDCDTINWLVGSQKGVLRKVRSRVGHLVRIVSVWVNLWGICACMLPSGSTRNPVVVFKRIKD